MKFLENQIDYKKTNLKIEKVINDGDLILIVYKDKKWSLLKSEIDEGDIVTKQITLYLHDIKNSIKYRNKNIIYPDSVHILVKGDIINYDIFSEIIEKIKIKDFNDEFVKYFNLYHYESTYFFDKLKKIEDMTIEYVLSLSVHEKNDFKSFKKDFDNQLFRFKLELLNDINCSENNQLNNIGEKLYLLFNNRLKSISEKLFPKDKIIFEHI